MTKYGLKDIPLQRIDEETLGITEYANSLSEFIRQCETPITIALQGDWGSGKTSLMNIIRENFQADQNIKTVWFNTWQYSQFGLQDELAISLLSYFLDSLGADEQAHNLVSAMRWGLKRVGKLAPSIAGALGGELAEKATEKLKEMVSSEETDPARQITKIKSEIEAVVRKRIGDDGKMRLVVFIDDLDRLLPIKAVELLEVFKLFLDVPGCVFVLACDYNVVSQGLKDKFNVSQDDLKGKSFFDKIIQLPFNMPLGHYNVSVYIKSLLEKIKVSYTEDDVAAYRDMICYSIGFNPRSIKRLFNSLLLLKLVASQKKLLDDEELIARNEKERVLFGILCLQTSFESVYSYLVKNADQIKQEFFENLKSEEKLLNDSMFAALREGVEMTSKFARNITHFMDSFYECIQLKSDNSRDLSQIEIDFLKKMLTFSSITSTDANAAGGGITDARYINRAMAKDFIEKLNTIFNEYLKFGEFKIYQQRGQNDICIYFVKNGYGPEIWFGDEGYSLWTFGWGNTCKETAFTWVTTKLIGNFPNAVEEEGIFNLIGINTNPKEPRENRVNAFKQDAIHWLEIILPTMVE
jgi:hypothetical protein